MKFTVCAYFDTELEKYQPAFLVGVPVADIVEGVTEAAIKGKVDDCEHKKLFLLGSFETTDASFDLEEAPRMILDLKSFVKDGAKA